MNLTDRIEGLVGRWLRVPSEPEPPPGSTGSVRIFRAAPEHFRYTMIAWTLAQLGTLAGLVFSFMWGYSFVEDQLDRWLPSTVVTLIEISAWLGYIWQLVVSFAALRLSFENRWYMLSDHALRIRDGVFQVREQTMTFANIQNIAVKQNPLQRLFGIADVEVHTAGGGGAKDESGHNMHRGYFRGVADAESIRDTIRQRVRAAQQDAQLEVAAEPEMLPEPVVESQSLDAARAVLEEARALRGALTAAKSG